MTTTHTSTDGLPPVHFVIGTGRCGSTLLHELLCHHRGVAFMSNVDDRVPGAWITSGLNGPLHRRLPHALTRKGRARFAPSEGYRALDREVSPAIAWSRRDLLAEDATPALVTRLRAFVERRAARQPGRSYVHKFTGWPRVGLLRAAFPEARFLHVVRDGRAVASSWLQQSWWRGHEGPHVWQWGDLSASHQALWDEHDRSPAVLAAIGWMVLLDAADEGRATLPGDAWLELRYEDLVAAPEQVMGQVTTLFDLAPDDVVTRTLRGYPFDPTRLDGWRRHLGDDRAAVLTDVLADHLADRGYVAT